MQIPRPDRRPMDSEAMRAESTESVYLVGSEIPRLHLGTFYCLYLSLGSSDPWLGAFWGLHLEESGCASPPGLSFQHTFHVETESVSLSFSEQERPGCLWVSHWSLPNFYQGSPKNTVGLFTTDEVWIWVCGLLGGLGRCAHPWPRVVIPELVHQTVHPCLAWAWAELPQIIWCAG